MSAYDEDTSKYGAEFIEKELAKKTPSSDREPMTPQERAEKIPLYVMYDIPGRKEETYSLIAQQIEEACAETIKEHVPVQFNSKIEMDSIREEARSQALEDAAKVAESQPCRYHAGLPEEIRALKTNRS